MIGLRRRLAVIKAGLGLWSRGWRRRETGAVSPIFALMLVPLIGGLGMGVEASNWYLTQRAMQNAADSAALAAATNGTVDEATKCAVVGDFCYEAKAAAARSGFTDGAGNVTVTADYLTSGCPGSVPSCYSVSINNKLPFYLLQVVGFKGDTTAGGVAAQLVVASSVARATTAADICMMALGAGKSFTVNGGPNVNLAGCNFWSNGDLKCNGANSDTGVVYGGAVGTSSCGATQASGQTAKSDPFSGLSANIPAANPACASYPQGTGSGAQPLTASTKAPLCGNYYLPANYNITTAGTEIVIYNGSLDLFGHTLSTSGSGSVTLIFSGPSGATGSKSALYNHILVDTAKGGVLDIAAPTSGNFSGVAFMQNNSLFDDKNDNVEPELRR